MVGTTKQASSATTAVAFITVGALMVVWSTVTWYFYLRGGDALTIHYLWDYGFFFSGLVLIAVGISLGRIARTARPAEVAPSPTGQPVTAPEAPQTAPVGTTNVPVAAVPVNGPAQPVAPVAIPAATQRPGS